MLKLKRPALRQHIEYVVVFYGLRNQYGPEEVIELPGGALLVDICANFSELAENEVIVLEARLLLSTGGESPVYIVARGVEGHDIFKCVDVRFLYTAMGGATYVDDVERGSVTVNITRITLRARSNLTEIHALPVDVYVRYYA
jgi:hypothetical protein